MFVVFAATDARRASLEAHIPVSVLLLLTPTPILRRNGSSAEVPTTYVPVNLKDSASNCRHTLLARITVPGGSAAVNCCVFTRWRCADGRPAVGCTAGAGPVRHRLHGLRVPPGGRPHRRLLHQSCVQRSNTHSLRHSCQEFACHMHCGMRAASPASHAAAGGAFIRLTRSVSSLFCCAPCSGALLWASSHQRHLVRTGLRNADTALTTACWSTGTPCEVSLHMHRSC